MTEDNSKLLEIFYLTWPNLPRTKKKEEDKPPTTDTQKPL